MSEEQVVEAIEETPEVEEPSIDIAKASDQIAENIFGAKPEEPQEEIEEVVEEVVEEVAEKDAEEKEEIEQKEAKEPPSSWKKEMREAFQSLDPDVQEYIELREEQMKNGVEVRKEDADLGMRMRDAMAPYSQMLKAQGVDQVDAARRLMNAHATLVSATPEQRKEYFDQLAQSYGISQETEEGDIDPRMKQLQNQVQQLQMKLQAQEIASTQEREEKVTRTVQEFAKEHPHFDDLSDEIAKLIRAGYELGDAYKVAYRASDYFEKDLEKKQKDKSKEELEAKKKEAEKAKKAKSVNVRTRDTGKTPTGPLGTMEDTMKDVYRQIQNRT